MGRLVLNHSTNIEGLIPILRKLALDINIKTVTPAVISRVKGKSSKLIIRISVKTINGYKAIARKGTTAQEVFISTDLSKADLKQVIDTYSRKWFNKWKSEFNHHRWNEIIIKFFFFFICFAYIW